MNEETVRAGEEATKEVAATTGKALDLAGKLSSYFDGMLPRHLRNAPFSDLSPDV